MPDREASADNSINLHLVNCGRPAAVLALADIWACVHSASPLGLTPFSESPSIDSVRRNGTLWQSSAQTDS
jgi:hypothetical protein